MARAHERSVLIMVSDADTRRVGRMNSWWIFSGFFGYTFVVLNLVGESVYPAVLAHRSNTSTLKMKYLRKTAKFSLVSSFFFVGT